MTMPGLRASLMLRAGSQRMPSLRWPSCCLQELEDRPGLAHILYDPVRGATSTVRVSDAPSDSRSVVEGDSGK